MMTFDIPPHFNSTESLVFARSFLLDAVANMVSGSRLFSSIPLDKFLTGTFNTGSSGNDKGARFLLSERYGPPSIVAMAATALGANWPAFPAFLKSQGGQFEFAHPSAIISPALFAVSDYLHQEKAQIDSADFLLAFLIGLVVPVGLAISKPELSYTSCLSVGVVSMAAQLKKLPTNKINAALLIALQTSLDQPNEFYSPGKLHPMAWCSRTGVEAFLLADKGFDWIDHSVSSVTAQDIQNIISNEGNMKLLFDLSFYRSSPIHSSILSPVMCLEKLIAKHPAHFNRFEDSRIKNVLIKTNAFNNQNGEPSSMQEAYSNITWIAARKVLGWQGQEYHSDDKHDAQLLEMLNKVAVVPLPSNQTALFTEIRIQLATETITEVISHQSDLGMTWEKVAAKWDNVGPAIIGVDPTRIIGEVIQNLGIHSQNIGDQFDLLYSRVAFD